MNLTIIARGVRGSSAIGIFALSVVLGNLGCQDGIKGSDQEDSVEDRRPRTYDCVSCPADWGVCDAGGVDGTGGTGGTGGSAGGEPGSYFVDPGGDDDNGLGTQDRPFQTVQKCASLAQPGDTCFIRAGTYRETIAPARSGETGRPITFTAYQKEPVTISGADLVSGWQPYQGSIFLSSIAWDLGAGKNQVFVDGQMMTEARWPNTDADPSHPTYAVATDGSFPADHDFGVPVDPDERWTIYDPALTEAAGFWDGALVNHLSNVGLVAQSGIVTASAPGQIEFSLLGNQYGVGPNTWYYLTGKLEALDAPREWFLDAGGTLYLWAPAGDDPSGHVVEAKRRLAAFDLSGRSNIVVRGVRIFAATIVTDMSSSDILLDGIDASYVSHLTRIEGLGGGWWAGWNTGIQLHGTRNTLANSNIAYSAANGVELLGSDHRVTNCIIHDVDYLALDSSGVYMHSRTDARIGVTGYSSTGHEVSYNTLYNSGRTLIQHETARGIRIVNNLLYDANWQTTDSGFTYTYATDGGGSEMAYNLMHDSRNGGGGTNCGGCSNGIYLDDAGSNYVVHHNVIWNVPYSAIYTNKSSYVQIFNNTLWYAGFANDGFGTNIQTYNNLGQTPFFGDDQQGNLTTDDPRFFDLGAVDFRLQGDSPAIDHGVEIPGITDGFVGLAPDSGAYEFGGPLWRAGASRLGF
jgi:hypothetical protein